MSTAKPRASERIAITGTSDEAAFAIDTNDGVSLLIASIHFDTDDDDDDDDIDDTACQSRVS